MEKIFDDDRRPVFPRTLIVGLLLLLFGGLLIAKYLYILPIEASQIIFSWQMLLIVIGLIGLIPGRHRPAGQHIGGNIVLIFIGLYFMLVKFYHPPIESHRFFLALLFILFGILILFKRRPHWEKQWKVDKHSTSSDFLDDFSVFSGGKMNILSENFKGGKVVNVFGGSEINLSKAKLSDGSNIIDVLMVFGGSKFIVPAEWNVKIDVMSIFGGFSDKRFIISSPDKSGKELVIKGICIFGGGELRSA